MLGSGGRDMKREEATSILWTHVVNWILVCDCKSELHGVEGEGKENWYHAKRSQDLWVATPWQYLDLTKKIQQD